MYMTGLKWVISSALISEMNSHTPRFEDNYSWATLDIMWPADARHEYLGHNHLCSHMLNTGWGQVLLDVRLSSIIHVVCVICLWEMGVQGPGIGRHVGLCSIGV